MESDSARRAHLIRPIARERPVFGCTITPRGLGADPSPLPAYRVGNDDIAVGGVGDTPRTSRTNRALQKSKATGASRSTKLASETGSAGTPRRKSTSSRHHAANLENTASTASGSQQPATQQGDVRERTGVQRFRHALHATGSRVSGLYRVLKKEQPQKPLPPARPHGTNPERRRLPAALLESFPTQQTDSRPHAR